LYAVLGKDYTTSIVTVPVSSLLLQSDGISL